MDRHLEDSFSIAQAKNRLPALVHQAETTGCVELTRRGKAVAVILSMDEYKSLKNPPTDGWWSSVLAWREQTDFSDWEGWTDEEVDSWRSAEIGRPVDL